MKLLNTIVIALFLHLISGVKAILQPSPPDSALVRFYDNPNCDVKYHETGIKDFKRVVCGSKIDPSSCVFGNFLSYRFEENPGQNDSLPKIDKLVVKSNSTSCDLQSEMPGDIRVFEPHPLDNPNFLSSGCHLFNPTNQLGIDPSEKISYSYWCTWGTHMPSMSRFDAEEDNTEGSMQQPTDDQQQQQQPLEEGLQEDELGTKIPQDQQQFQQQQQMPPPKQMLPPLSDSQQAIPSPQQQQFPLPQQPDSPPFPPQQLSSSPSPKQVPP